MQGNIDICLNNSKEIETVFKNLDAEFKTFMQEQLVDEIPVLKSSVSDNRPLMDPVSISEVTDILFKCQKKLRGLVEQCFEVSVMSKIVGQVVKEITKIRNSMDRFQYVEVLETIMKDLRKGLIDAQTVLYNERLKLAKKQRF